MARAQQSEKLYFFLRRFILTPIGGVQSESEPLFIIQMPRSS